MGPIRLFNEWEFPQGGACSCWLDRPSSRWGGRNTSPSPSLETTGPHSNSPSSTRTKIQRKETVKRLTPLRSSRTRVETWADSIVEFFECQQLIIYISHRESRATVRRKKAESCMQLNRGTAQRNFPDQSNSSWL